MTISPDDNPDLEQNDEPLDSLHDDESVSPGDPVLIPSFDLNDFDDEFDDDFEAEVAGEYEMDDDEFARQLVNMVDFEIEGLGNLDDDDDESDRKASADGPVDD